MCSEMMPRPPIISVLLAEYTPLTVMMGMKSKIRKMMPRGFGTQS